MYHLQDVMLATTIQARSMARRLRLIDLYVRTKNQTGTGTPREYEPEFDRAMVRTARVGDCVWDIGANLGIYTKKFSDAVGSEGQVVAVEPVPPCFDSLKDAVSDCSNVKLVNAAVGRSDGSMRMTMADNPLGATHEISLDQSSKDAILVDVVSPTTLLKDTSERKPDLVKIDVEGFEEEVLLGFCDLPPDMLPTHFFIEVHFGLLQKRGEKMAPVRICSKLRGRGYRLTWIDASHLHASRN